MPKNELQFDLLKTELEFTQRQMDKYDQLSGTIKTWAVTLWAASLGWAFQINRKEIILLSIFIVTAFWTLDAVNKNFRQDYKKRRKEVTLLLQKIFKDAPLPEDTLSPNLPLHRWRNVPKEIFRPHIFILYLALITISGIMFSLV